MDDIREFQGQYRWLSNFWPATVELDGVIYSTVEHAYQASKTIFPAQRMWVYECKTPGDAKRMGRELSLRPNWENVKKSQMDVLVRQKFTRHPGLRILLENTGNCEIVEGNYWHDNFWGRCYCDKCKPRLWFNYLGIILMGIRNEFWETSTEQGE